MRVGRQQVNHTLGEHALPPILRTIAEAAGNRAGRYLQPGALPRGVDQPAVVLLVDPGQPLRVSDDGHVSVR